jgi:hypothetical protein
MAWTAKIIDVIVGKKNWQSVEFWVSVIPPAISVFGFIVAGLQIADWLRYLIENWESAVHWFWTVLLSPLSIKVSKPLAGAITFCCFTIVAAIRAGHDDPIKKWESHLVKRMGLLLLLCVLVAFGVILSIFIVSFLSWRSDYLFILCIFILTTLSYTVLTRDKKFISTPLYFTGILFLLYFFGKHIASGVDVPEDERKMGSFLVLAGFLTPFFIASLRNYFKYLATIGTLVAVLFGASQLHLLRLYIENPPDQWSRNVR